MLALLARRLARASPNWLRSRLSLARSNLTPTWPLRLRSGQRSSVQPTSSQNSAPTTGLGSRTVPSLRLRFESDAPQSTDIGRHVGHASSVPCMDGARGAREKNLTFRETIRVQPCIRPLDAAVLAAGPDVIR